MIICEHDETENDGDMQFTVIFEGHEESKVLRAIVASKANLATTFEQALDLLIGSGYVV